MLAWFLENTLVAGGLALLVAAAVRLRFSRPATAHLLWLATLAVLLMPRIPWLATPGAELRGVLRTWLGARTAPVDAVGPELSDPAAEVELGGIGLEVAPASFVPGARPAPGRGSAPWRVAPPDLDDLGTAAVLVWLGGAALVLARSARRILPFQRLVARAPLAPSALRREVGEVARRLGVRAPEVRIVAGVASPSVWCLGRPRLLWPAVTGAAASRRARRALIAHELAHLARRDHWVSWLEIPAAALAWWNPLFWWIRGRIRHYAELSCDAWAVWAYPADRRVFAEALIDMQARTRTAPIALQGLGATDSECKDFERRLDMIMKKKGKFPGVSKGAALATAVIAVLASPGFSGDGKTCATTASKEHGSSAASVLESRAKSVELSRKVKDLLGASQDAEALATLQEVVALDPENGWAHSQIGHLQLRAGRVEAARKSFQRQYELGHERPTAYYNAGCAAALANDRLAWEFLTAAVCTGFTNADLMEKDADLDSLRKDARFDELVRKARAVAELRQELARLETEGNAQLFLATHGELAALLSGDGKLQAEHGHMALQAGDAEGSALAFGRQIEAEHDVPTAYYNRACARARGGDREGAMSDLRAAAERGMGYDGVAKDTDLDSLRKLPGFADVQERIVTKAEETQQLKALLASENAADAPALTALAADASRPNKIRALAAQALGRLELRGERFADAYATFERAAELGVEVRQSAFGMAQALARGGKAGEARRHVELALDLGYADPDALRALLESSALAAPADAEAMVARAAKARDVSKAAYGEKGKAWAAGMKKPQVYGAKVAQD